MTQQRLQSAIGRLNFAHSLVHQYIDELSPEEWFFMPTGDVTHVAWQVGHLGLVEYYLLMKRVRGDRDEDATLLPVEEFSTEFGRGSTPNPDPQMNPSSDQLMETIDRVHAAAIEEVSQRSDEELDVALQEPHPVFKTKLEAVEFCSQHELLHAGQIALLRRLMGKPPLR